MSSSQPRLQPPPPASPTHNESRRSSAKAGRPVRSSLKSQTASTNSICKTADGPDTTTTAKTVVVLKGEQKPPEPRPTCTVVQPSKNRRTVKEEQTHCDGKGDHTRSPSGNGPEEQPKDEALRLGRFQEQIPGVTRDGARHTNKAEVRSAFSLNTPGWQRVGLEHGGNASMGLPSRSHQSSRQREV